ncbi:hypothetical protein LJC64_04495 [Ruminococcaceae bacterium OttesenSCG-928-A11]|nr:hypothetical protein [Ruminococcaceae bacterium OttesenSCG-928-A11]
MASTASINTAGGKGVNGQSAVIDKSDKYNSLNSIYTITLQLSDPSAQTEASAPYSQIDLNAGVLPTDDGKFTASAKGWEFLGWYSAQSGGVQVIGPGGSFVRFVEGYTSYTGGWIYGDDGTLYSQWRAGVYQVTLNNQGATTSGTTAVWAKHDHGWYGNAATTGNKLASITVPARPGFTFLGYYTEADGGTMLIDENGDFVANSFNEISAQAALYAIWKATPYQVTLNMTVGSDPYTAADVQLFQHGYLRYTLAEDGATGVYETQRIVPCGVYDVVVDGLAVGRSVTVAPDENDATINTFTLAFERITVETKLDNTANEVDTVSLRQNGVVRWNTAWDATAKHHWAAVLHNSAADANNTYDIYVGLQKVEQQVNTTTAKTAEVVFYTATLQLTYDEEWDDAVVSLRQDGKVVHNLVYSSSQQSNGVYVNPVAGSFSITEEMTLYAIWGDNDAAETTSEARWTIGGQTNPDGTPLVYYGSLMEALAAAQNNDTPVQIVVLNSCKMISDAALGGEDSLTINQLGGPNGETPVVVTVNAGATLTNSGAIANGGTLDVKGTLKNTGTLTNNGAVEGTGTLENSGTLTNTNGSLAVDDVNNTGGTLSGGVIASSTTVSGGTL